MLAVGRDCRPRFAIRPGEANPLQPKVLTPQFRAQPHKVFGVPRIHPVPSLTGLFVALSRLNQYDPTRTFTGQLAALLAEIAQLPIRVKEQDVTLQFPRCRLRIQRCLTPLVGVVQRCGALRSVTRRCRLVDIAKGHAGRIANLHEDLSRCIHDEHVRLGYSGARLLGLLHYLCIAPAVRLQRLQNLDLADGIRDDHFAGLVTEPRRHSGLQRSVNE